MVGGEQKFAISLGNWLARQSHNIILMGSGFATIKTKHLSNIQAKEDNKITERKLRKVRILNPPYFIYSLSRLVMSLLWILKLVSINIQSPISLIHAQDTGYSGLAAIVAGKILRIPVIISSHGIRHKSLESIIKGRFKNILLRIEYKLDLFTVRNATSVIVVNHSIKDYFEKVALRKIDFIPIPIRLKDFEFSENTRHEVRKEIGIDEKTVVIGFVGRFSPEKNLFTLLHSFANVIKQGNSKLNLVLVGAGPLESQLKDYISKSAIEDKVIFCGVRYDINRVLSCFDIFVLPSYTEGLSTALLEAMASGRAIICSDIPGNRELVEDGKEGLLMNPYKSEELERAIRELSVNSSLQSRLGNNAKSKATHYDDQVIFSDILQYYRDLLKEARLKD